MTRRLLLAATREVDGKVRPQVEAQRGEASRSEVVVSGCRACTGSLQQKEGQEDSRGAVWSWARRNGPCEGSGEDSAPFKEETYVAVPLDLGPRVGASSCSHCLRLSLRGPVS